jgi:replicative DNA helicase
LKPKQFADQANAYIYYAIGELVKKNVTKIDAFGITQILALRKSTEDALKYITPESINDLIEAAPIVARSAKEEYRILVDNVRNKAFAREALAKLAYCQGLCHKEDIESLPSSIYKEIESLVFQYQRVDDVILFCDQVDTLWKEEQETETTGEITDFPIKEINRYCKMERGEALVVSAQEKRGKSILLMNIMTHFLKLGMGGITIDTEIKTKQFYRRLLAHIGQVEYHKIRDKTYDKVELERLKSANTWLKGTRFIHKYVPVLDDDILLGLVKKAAHTHKIDLVILDYLKANGENSMDAFKNSMALGKTLDLMKNVIAGDMNLYALTAVQATENGGVAFSKNIKRNCSSLMYLERKTKQQIVADGGLEYGNMTMNVQTNRNGEIMGDDDYISLMFKGNLCTFENCLQPVRQEPY